MILVAGRPFREWIGDEIPKAVPHSYPSKSQNRHVLFMEMGAMWAF